MRVCGVADEKRAHSPHFADFWWQSSARPGTTNSKQHTISVANLVFKKVSEKCLFELISGNFHEVLPDFLVFWKFYSNDLTEIKYSDNAIEFYTENYILGQIFKKGTQKMPALVPHPTVWNKNSIQNSLRLLVVQIRILELQIELALTIISSHCLLTRYFTHHYTIFL